MATAAGCDSDALRAAGNEAFKRSQAAGIAKVLVESRLAEAAGLYADAARAATTDEQRASANKNLGVAASKAVSLLSVKEAGMRPYVARVRDAQCAFAEAITSGVAAGKGAAWLDDVRERARVAMQAAVDAISSCGENFETRSRMLLRLNATLAAGVHARPWEPAAVCALRAAERLFQATVVLIEVAGATRKGAAAPAAAAGGGGGTAAAAATPAAPEDIADGSAGRGPAPWLGPRDYEAERIAVRKGLPALTECASLLEHARTLLGEGAAELRSAIDDVGRSVHAHAVLLESRQARLEGDATLACAMAEESPAMEGVWAAADCYKEAVRLAREADLEGEAIASTALARLFWEVLKDSPRARAYALQAVALAMACSPRSFHSQDWYRRATEIAQRTAPVPEPAAVPAPEELRPILRAIDEAAAKGAVDLLRHVYAHHPPRTRGELKAGGTLGAVTADKVKATLKDAVVAYHPDRQRTGEADDARWRILTSNISANLNAAWERMKGF